MQLHTEPPSESTPIDVLSSSDAVACMVASHASAVVAVRAAEGEICEAARLLADTLEAGGRIHYAAAGSSGLMALADACELPGTFGVPQEQIRICMAGGVPVDGEMPGDTEDSVSGAKEAAKEVQHNDVAIVVSASGTTPYALSFAEEASRRGAKVIGLANVAGSALLVGAEIAIELDTAAEVLEGSTRLGAGTAQKVALNLISTYAGVLMGHVHDGMMVNLNPENIKLRRRAANIVARIAKVPSQEAENALAQTGYDTKLATLIAFGVGIDDAKTLLAKHQGRLRACLDALGNRSEVKK